MSPNTNVEKPSRRKQYILTQDIEKSLGEIQNVKKDLANKISADETVFTEIKDILARLESKISLLEENIQSSYKNARKQFYSE